VLVAIFLDVAEVLDISIDEKYVVDWGKGSFRSVGASELNGHRR